MNLLHAALVAPAAVGGAEQSPNLNSSLIGGLIVGGDEPCDPRTFRLGLSSKQSRRALIQV